MMRSIEKFWKMVGILERSIENSNNEQMKNWWKLKLMNFMLKLECYEDKALN
jgi:hypothetical protein